MAGPNDPGQQPPNDGADQLRALIRSVLSDVLQNDVLPLLERRQRETVNAEVNARLSNAAISSEVAGTLSASFSKELQDIADKIGARVRTVEEALANIVRGIETVPARPVEAAQHSSSPTIADRASATVALADGFLNLVTEKLLPAFLQFKQASSPGWMDIQAAQNLRNTDPVRAVVLANVLNPDPMAAQMPQIMFNSGMAGFNAGIRTKVSALQGAGGGTWPGTPSSPYGSPTGALPGTPSSSAGRPGAQMQANGAPNGNDPSQTARSNAGNVPGGRQRTKIIDVLNYQVTS